MTDTLGLKLARELDEMAHRLGEMADELAALSEGGQSDPDPGELAAPAAFAARYDASTRRVTCSWTPQADAVEVHERWKDPDATLKATVAAGGGSRVSSLLGGGPYEWAARSVRDGGVSAFTEWVLTDVPRKGDDDEDQDEDEHEEPGGEEPQPGGPHPSDAIPLLADWTIMLPTGSPGDPDNEYLVGRSIAGTYFVRDGGVVFRTHPGTANHSANSKYGRTEARQMVPGQPWEKSSWPSSEPHRLTARLAVDTSRLAHPIVNALQIHDGGDDVIQVQVRNGVLGVAHDDGDSWEIIDAYAGEPFEMDIYVTGSGEIVFTYNGDEAVRIDKTGSGWYWKAGDYPNTGGANTDRPEDPAAYAEVVLYELAADPA